MIEVIDIAEYAAAGREIPRKKRYQIQIDKQTFIVEKECLSGKELLALAGKEPTRFQLRQKFRFNRIEIVELDEIVDLATCGVEKFLTLPLDQTEGKSNRQDFFLPESDISFLNSQDFNWDTIRENGVQWLILRQLPILKGYNVEIVDIAFQIDGAYPQTQIDMAYFYPALSRKDGKGINALTYQVIENKSYQRWSRHRTANNPWRVELDDISTHLAFVENWLISELTK